MAIHKKRGPAISSLEDRVLFSASPLVSLDAAGVLSVEGTDQADAVQVRETADKVVVQSTVDGETDVQEFDKSEVSELFFSAMMAMTCSSTIQI